MAQKNRVDVVMLTNTANDEYYKMTMNSINSLFKSTGVSINLLLVETSFTPKYEYDVAYMLAGDKFNYNKFINYALDNFRKNIRGSYFMICHNDTVFYPDTISKMIEAFENDNSISSQSPWEKRLHDRLYDIQNNKIGYGVKTHVTPWCIMLRWRAIDIVKTLDEDFDFFYQDADFAQTIKKYGIKHMLNSNSIIIHLGELNNGIGKSQSFIPKDSYYTMQRDAKDLFDKKWNIK